MGGTSSGDKAIISPSTAQSPRKQASGVAHSGPNHATPARGARNAVVVGTAMRFARGAVGDTSWNHHAAAGSVPTVAATVTDIPDQAHRTPLGQRSGTARCSPGARRPRPRTAPNESWNPGVAALAGSSTTRMHATPDSRGTSVGRAPRARIPAASTRSSAARCALIGAPTTAANATAARPAASHAAPVGTPRGRASATMRSPARTAQATAPATIPTWKPEIASRWAVPVRRRRRVTSGETYFRSPRARARSTPACAEPAGRGRSTGAPITSTWRTFTSVRIRASGTPSTGPGAPGSSGA